MVNQYTKKKNWGITNDFTFGGYGKIKPELINFMNNFYKQYKIPLDPVYRKMLLLFLNLSRKINGDGERKFGLFILRALESLNEQLLREKKITNLTY